MVQRYDFVITSGGIGPTHDGTHRLEITVPLDLANPRFILCLLSADITYASLAKAFNQPLVHHAETLRRMTELSKHRSWIHTQDQEQRSARQRMALFPANAETLFVARDMWVVSTTIQSPPPPPPPPHFLQVI